MYNPLYTLTCSSESDSYEEWLCQFPISLRSWSPSQGHAYFNNTHSLKASLTQGFLHFLQQVTRKTSQVMKELEWASNQYNLWRSDKGWGLSKIIWATNQLCLWDETVIKTLTTKAHTFLFWWTNQCARTVMYLGLLKLDYNLFCVLIFDLSMCTWDKCVFCCCLVECLCMSLWHSESIECSVLFSLLFCLFAHHPWT